MDGERGREGRERRKGREGGEQRDGKADLGELTAIHLHKLLIEMLAFVIFQLIRMHAACA